MKEPQSYQEMFYYILTELKKQTDEYFEAKKKEFDEYVDGKIEEKLKCVQENGAGEWEDVFEG